jgi:hypothetical protein
VSDKGSHERRSATQEHVPPAFERRHADNVMRHSHTDGHPSADHPDRNLAMELVRVTE